MNVVLSSLPVTLAARLLPVAVLATVGWTMTSGTHPAAPVKVSAAPPQQSPSVQPTTSTVAYSKPPSACTSLPASVVKSLVPGANTAGSALTTSDPMRRTGCSWNALQGYDYQWLDVTFEVSASVAEARTAYAAQAKQAGATTASGVGDAVSAIGQLTTTGGQQTRQAVVIALKGNEVVTVTYNGSNFSTKQAPSDAVIRSGAFKAATAAVAALGSGAAG
jgi:hypothetical protein